MFQYHLHLQYTKLDEVQLLMLLLDIIYMEWYYEQVLHHHVLEIFLNKYLFIKLSNTIKPSY